MSSAGKNAERILKVEPGCLVVPVARFKERSEVLFPRPPTKASTVPSPPSAIGTFMHSASLKTFLIPLSIALQASIEVILSLNESGANTNFIFISSY